MARSINLSIEDDTLQQLHRMCGDDDKPIRDALGYLALWNRDGYAHVDICVLGKPDDLEIVAVYRAEPGAAVGYMIGAVWHDDHFGFHS